jgi:hypothetical protein
VKPHKVRYYLEQRDPDFAEKMAEVLCVYRQVKILKQAAAVSKEKKKPSDAVAIISYDEKPGIQAIATTAPDLPPKRCCHIRVASKQELKDRLMAAMEFFNGDPVAHTWTSSSKSGERAHFRDSRISGEVIPPLGWSFCRPFFLDCARCTLTFRTPGRDAGATSR